jgi:hypothetical protein
MSSLVFHMVSRLPGMVLLGCPRVAPDVGRVPAANFSLVVPLWRLSGMVSLASRQLTSFDLENS